MTDDVLVHDDGPVRTITLHRPAARNALNRALQRASAEALRSADADDAVAVIVLTGSDPAFCAGLDLKELGAGGANLRGSADDAGDSPFAALEQSRTPVIGAVNGPCVTGGFELALACDFLVASERATFGDTHARVGVSPGGGMSVRLPMAVGLARAKELSLTGNFVDASTARRVGLVNHVVPHDELLPFARRLAHDIASNDRAAVRHLKRLYDDNARMTVADALAHEQRWFREWTVDFAEVERRRGAVIRRGRSQQPPGTGPAGPPGGGAR